MEDEARGRERSAQGAGGGVASAAIALAEPAFRAEQLPSKLTVGYATRILDMNGDGKPDLAAISDATPNLIVLLGNGQGGFAAAGSFPLIRTALPSAEFGSIFKS